MAASQRFDSAVEHEVDLLSACCCVQSGNYRRRFLNRNSSWVHAIRDSILVYCFTFSIALLNTRGCNNVAQLLNSKRAYLTTVCEITFARNYSDSVNYCEAKGMELLKVSSGELRSALFNYSYPRYYRGAGSVIWVKGSFDCSAIFNGFGPFREVDYSCSKANFFMCEFIDKLPADGLMNLTEILTK